MSGRSRDGSQTAQYVLEDPFINSVEIDKKTTLLIWYTAVSMFSFTKLPWITYSFFTLAGRKTGLSKYWSERQQKQQDVQQEQTNDKNLKTQRTPWQQFSSISRIISRASLLLLFINALQSNNNDYIDSALNIFSEDEKNPVFIFCAETINRICLFD